MNGMKRRKRSRVHGFGDIQNTVMNGVLPAAAGYVAGDVLTKQLTFLASNANTGNLVKLAAGIFLSGQRGFVGGMGVGLAANGAVGFILPALKNSGIALLPPGVPARYLAGPGAPSEFGRAAGENPVKVVY